MYRATWFDQLNLHRFGIRDLHWNNEDHVVAITVVQQCWRQLVEAKAMNSFRMCNLQSRDYSNAIWYSHAITTAMVQSVYCKIYTGLVAIGT